MKKASDSQDIEILLMGNPGNILGSYKCTFITACIELADAKC